MDRSEPPFGEGQLVRSRDSGILYRVTRPYVAPEPGYADLGCFELVREDPPRPFTQAMSMARFYETVEPKAAGTGGEAPHNPSPAVPAPGSPGEETGDG